MKTILVTGGAGFLGSNLCTKLVENKNNKVICVDNLSTGNISNLENLLKLDNFIFIKEDIENKNLSDKFNFKIDEIYNAACPASPIHYQENPIKTTTTCVLGILNLIELARKNNSKLLQFSTSEVYGEPEISPQPEEYRGCVNTIGIRSCYDEGKRCAESLCFDARRMYHLDIKVVRIFNTYGPYMDKNDGRVVSNFICQALKNEDITMYGTGLQTRSFCYVSDLINGLIKMMESDLSGPVNLGNPGEFTMLELAELVLLKTGSTSTIKYLPLPSDDPTQRKPDISKARNLLSWEPKIKLSKGLDRTIEYFRNLINKN